MRESEQRFKAIFNTTFQFIGLMEPGGTMVEINQTALDFGGLRRKDVIGQLCWKCSWWAGSPETQQTLRQAIDRAARGEFIRYNVDMLGMKENIATIDFSVKPVINDANEVILLIFEGRDITEIKQTEAEQQALEAQVRHTQKLESLGVLAGGIAHDFNNIIFIMMGNADLALMELSPESPVREYVKEIKKGASRAAELCGQMLAYSGKGKFVVEPINLSHVVEEMAHMLEISISKKAILRYHFANNLPSIEADVTQIRQVIMNLITNASDAIGDRSGVISISTGVIESDQAYLNGTFLDEDLPEGLYVTLEVADTGCGIDEQTRAKIFEPFYTTKFTGRGLGLAAVLGIVRGHGGTIKIYSELDKGTTFKLLLPAASGEVAALSGTNNQQNDWCGEGTILLVDDEVSVRTLGKRMLEKMGFSVLVASDGHQAVQVYCEKGDEVTCVLLDMTMPRM
ncbi:MAG: ATP-binding protein, partial [bacterium]